MADDSKPIRAGRAYVEAFGDDPESQAGLRRAQQRIAGFGAAMGALENSPEVKEARAQERSAIQEFARLIAESAEDTRRELAELGHDPPNSIEQWVEIAEIIGKQPEQIGGMNLADILHAARIYKKRADYHADILAAAIKKAEPAKPYTDPSELVAMPELAKRGGLGDKQKERLRNRLKTWRQANLDGGWIENTEAKPREPKYLFPIGKVWPIVEAVKDPA